MEGDLLLRILLILSFVITSCLTVEVKKLTAVVGASITFPDPVTQRGFLIFGPVAIASVYEGTFEIEEDFYRNRLHWSNTGHFTLTDLQKNDSGLYAVNSKRGTVFYGQYELNIYDPVPAPVVTTVNVTTDVCAVACSVSNTEQTTLSWLKGDTVISSSSGVLPLTVHQRNYTSDLTLVTCVAQNPAERKTIEVNLATVCKFSEKQTNGEDDSKRKYYVYILIPIILTVLLLCLAVFVKIKYCSKKGTGQLQSQEL